MAAACSWRSSGDTPPLLLICALKLARRESEEGAVRTNSTAASQSGGPLPLTPASSSVQPAHLHLLTRGNHRLLRASWLLGFTEKKKEEKKRSPNPNHGSVDKVAVVVQLLPRRKCRLRRQVRAHGSTFVRAHLSGTCLARKRARCFTVYTRLKKEKEKRGKQ